MSAFAPLREIHSLRLCVKYILRAFAPLREIHPARLRVKYILRAFAPLREIHSSRLYQGIYLVGEPSGR